MQLPIEYMVKTSVCLTVGYIFYYLLLRRITHYTWNRWFLLLCTIGSFIIPAININLFVAPEQLNNIYFVSKLPVVYTASPASPAPVTAPSVFTMQNVAAGIFVTGILLLVARLGVQYLSLKRIQSKAKLVSNGDGDIRLYHLDESIAPFSFNNNIYCNNNMYSQQELEEVIRHELVHVQQKHTVDVLLAEVLCILNWYNPFAWMIKHAIKENLEFIADDNVLQHGINRQQYQYLLLKVTGNIPQVSFTNNLNFASLKKRIAMMNRSKTSKLHLFKFMFIVPLACVLLVSFRQGTHSTSTEPPVQKAESTNDETFMLGTLTYSISNAAVETIVKNDQSNSFLQTGKTLRLSALQNEKHRLANLLNKSGYDTSGEHAIYFMVDTFSTNKSFSIQININVAPKKSVSKTATQLPAKTAMLLPVEGMQRLNHITPQPNVGKYVSMLSNTSLTKANANNQRI